MIRQHGVTALWIMAASLLLLALFRMYQNPWLEILLETWSLC